MSFIWTVPEVPVYYECRQEYYQMSEFLSVCQGEGNPVRASTDGAFGSSTARPDNNCEENQHTFRGRGGKINKNGTPTWSPSSERVERLLCLPATSSAGSRR